MRKLLCLLLLILAGITHAWAQDISPFASIDRAAKTVSVCIDLGCNRPDFIKLANGFATELALLKDIQPQPDADVLKAYDIVLTALKDVAFLIHEEQRGGGDMVAISVQKTVEGKNVLRLLGRSEFAPSVRRPELQLLIERNGLQTKILTRVFRDRHTVIENIDVGLAETTETSVTIYLSLALRGMIPVVAKRLNEASTLRTLHATQPK